MGQSESSAQEADNCNCRILVVGKKTGDDALSELCNLPSNAKIVATGCSLAELREEGYEFTEVVGFPRVAGRLLVLIELLLLLGFVNLTAVLIIFGCLKLKLSK